jgi:hypothetical protein
MAIPGHRKGFWGFQAGCACRFTKAYQLGEIHGKHSDRLRAHDTRTNNEEGSSHYGRSASGQKSDIGNGQENETLNERLKLRCGFKHHRDDGQGPGIGLALREQSD